MQRIVEPEVMDGVRQVRAYAEADFSEPNALFVELLKHHHGEHLNGSCLDLGCGPGDICFRMARDFPQLHITGVDGAKNMLDYARSLLDREGLGDQVQFEQHLLPSSELPARHFDVITSNSLLHHLHDPRVLWRAVLHCGKPGAIVHVMDLYRPDSEEAARNIVDTYAADEADILQEDFYNSLLAAFTPDEVDSQLHAAGLNQLTIEIISDRHLLIRGRLNAD